MQALHMTQKASTCHHPQQHQTDSCHSALPHLWLVFQPVSVCRMLLNTLRRTLTTCVSMQIVVEDTCDAHTQVIPDIHIMLEVYQFLDGAHMAPIGSGVQGRELVRIPAVHLVAQLPNKQIYEGHPALFCCHMHGGPALF